VLDDGAKTAVKTILEKSSKTEKPVQLYDICMDTATVNFLGASPLLPLLQSLGSSYGSLPAVEGSVSFLHMRGVSSFFSVYVDADPVEPSRYSLTMQQGGMTLPSKDYYVNNAAAYKTARVEFKAFVKNVFYAMTQEASLATELSSLFTAATAEQAAADVFDVEMQIANVSNFNAELRNSEAMYNPTTLAAMTSPGAFSFVQWGRGIGSSPALTDVITTTRTYFPAISSIISRLATREPLKLKRYLTWRAVQPALPFLSATYVDLNFQFFGKLLSGTSQPLTTTPLLCIEKRFSQVPSLPLPALPFASPPSTAFSVLTWAGYTCRSSFRRSSARPWRI
jgi:predicted metalloendopeptidase